MPLVQISLLRGKPAPYLRAIAYGVHQALVATFETPLKDRFQTIQQLDPEELILDADSLPTQPVFEVSHPVSTDEYLVAGRRAEARQLGQKRQNWLDSSAPWQAASTGHGLAIPPAEGKASPRVLARCVEQAASHVAWNSLSARRGSVRPLAHPTAGACASRSRFY